MELKTEFERKAIVCLGFGRGGGGGGVGHFFCHRNLLISVW